MKYFSLFTGIGGLDRGLVKRAECVGFSEIRESSIKIYESHYPAHRNFGDLTKVDFAGLPDFDILTGGFPCQSFSMAGMRRGFADERGKMIFRICDLLMAKKPRFAVLENVKGLLNHDKGRTYRKVFALLRSAGYSVRCLLLNAMNYGSAQSRERIIFLCSREDFPSKSVEKRDGSKRFRDIRDASGPFDYVDVSRPKNEARINQRTGYDFDLIGGWDRVGTLTTAKYGGGGLRPSSQPKVVQEADGRFRFMSPTEAERLQGFPDGWTDGAKTADRWFALGNAVNCAMSDYIFNDYLVGLWWDK